MVLDLSLPRFREVETECRELGLVRADAWILGSCVAEAVQRFWA